MASVKLYYDTRRKKENSTYPLKLKLFHQGKARYIPLNYSFNEKEWNNIEQKVTSAFPNSGRANATIRKKLASATNVIADNEENLSAISIDELKEIVVEKVFGVTKELTKDKAVFLFEYTENIIEQLKKAKRVGSAESYRATLSAFQTYLKDKDILMSKIDLQFLKSFETNCLSNGLKINSIGVYLRTLRAIINRAIDEGYVPLEKYPFRKFKIKKENTAKRAISKADITKVVNLKIDKKDPRYHALNYFTFMFHTRGMNFIDLAYLKKENIVNGRLTYRRIKTGKLYNIKLTKRAQEIVNIYTKRRKMMNNDLIFPILPKEVIGDVEKERDRFRNRRKYFNKYLKDIGEMAGLEVELTSYVSRHTWASLAKFAGVAPAVIGESLGHSDLKTTETYLANFDTDILDDANELIVG